MLGRLTLLTCISRRRLRGVVAWMALTWAAEHGKKKFCLERWGCTRPASYTGCPLSPRREGRRCCPVVQGIDSLFAMLTMAMHGLGLILRHVRVMNLALEAGHAARATSFECRADNLLAAPLAQRGRSSRGRSRSWSSSSSRPQAYGQADPLRILQGGVLGGSGKEAEAADAFEPQVW